MKKLTIVLATFVAGLSAYVIVIPPAKISENKQNFLGTQEALHIQKFILPLFENICEDSVNPTIVRLAQEFNFDNPDDYFETDVLLKVQTLDNKLPKEEIFSEYDQNNLIELQTYYNILTKAKSFDTFMKIASWLRQNSNCGIFIDAIYLAVQNRKDTQKVYVPAPYEVLPNYFIRKEMIVQAASLLADISGANTENIKFEGNIYTVAANYTNEDDDNESKIAYFREDIGLNTYYFLNKLSNLSGGSISGEVWYHTITQLLARYNLERYSNGLPEVEQISWSSQSQYNYNPSLIFSNGNNFLPVTWNNGPQNTELLDQIQRIENNIQTFLISQESSNTSKAKLLNQLKDIFMKNNYIAYAKQIIRGLDTMSSSKSQTLDHYMTELRDPITWQLKKRIFDLVNGVLNQFPTYSRSQLYFPGVEVSNVEIKKFMNSMDNFEIDVTDSLKLNTKQPNFQVKISQPRLNNKPFSIKVSISSLTSQKGLVKLYLGPKMFPGELGLNKKLFYLLDTFECNLKTGSNVFTRSSQDFSNLADDFISMKNLRQNIEDAEFGLAAMPVQHNKSISGFPRRLILPRGSEDGFQIFVFVAPVIITTLSSESGSIVKEYNSAIQSPGYPLDLSLDDNSLFDLPNALVKDVAITYKGKSDAKNNYVYDPSNKPAYGPQKHGFNLNMKQEKYGKKPDYKTYLDKTTQTPHIQEPTDYSTTVSVETDTQSPTEISTRPQHIVNDAANANDDNGQVYAQEKTNVLDEASDFVEDTLNDLDELLVPSFFPTRVPSVFDYLMPKRKFDDFNEGDNDVKVYE